MTDRDHFAAAALTGLLYQEVDDEFAMPYIVGRAYLWADAMLRERCREGGDCPGQDNAANLDAVPAVKAGTPGTGDTPKPISGCVSDRSKPIAGPDPDSRVWETPVHTHATHATHGDGSVPREGTQEPAAWATFYPNGSTASVYVGRKPPHAEPLYRHPPCQDLSRKNLTLTDAEREAVERGYCSLMGVEDMSAECTRWDAEAAAVLRGLLERLRGVE